MLHTDHATLAPVTTTRQPERIATVHRLPSTPPPPSPSPVEADSAPITITHEDRLDGGVAERCWAVYRDNFEPLAALAIQSQVLDHDEFLDLLTNTEVVKIVAWQRGEPIGLGMITNALENIKELSVEFLAQRYPDHVRNRTVYAGNIIMVDTAHRGMTLFTRISTEMWQIPARAGGILVFDLCDFNRETFAAETVAHRIASPFPRSNVSVVDRQTWYVVDLPEPISG